MKLSDSELQLIARLRKQQKSIWLRSIFLIFLLGIIGFFIHLLWQTLHEWKSDPESKDIRVICALVLCLVFFIGYGLYAWRGESRTRLLLKFADDDDAHDAHDT